MYFLCSVILSILLVSQAAVAAKVRASDFANYLSSAKTTEGFIDLIQNPEERKYLEGLLDDGKLEMRYEVKISVEKPNTLVLKGDWGSVKFDFDKSDEKTIWINSEAFPVKSHYELGEFERRKSASFFLISEAFAQDKKSGKGFFTTLGSTIYNGVVNAPTDLNNWWNDTSGKIKKQIPNNVIRQLRCKNGKFYGIRGGELNFDFIYNYDENGNMSNVVMSMEGRQSCVFKPYSEGNKDGSLRWTSLDVKRLSKSNSGVDFCGDKNEHRMSDLSSLLSWLDVDYTKYGSTLNALVDCCKSATCTSKINAVASANDARYLQRESREKGPAPKISGTCQYALTKIDCVVDDPRSGVAFSKTVYRKGEATAHLSNSQLKSITKGANCRDITSVPECAGRRAGQSSGGTQADRSK